MPIMHIGENGFGENGFGKQCLVTAFRSEMPVTRPLVGG